MLSTLTMNPKPFQRPAVNALGFTGTQMEILKFVMRFRAVHPMGPSLDEIGAAIGRKKTAVKGQVDALLDADALRCEYMKFGKSERIREGSLHVSPEVSDLLHPALKKGSRP